jgi:hypothetical protein
MNTLFTFASAKDLQSDFKRLQEFKRLDDEILSMQKEMSLRELFRSLDYSLKLVRAKQILRQLKLID